MTSNHNLRHHAQVAAEGKELYLQVLREMALHRGLLERVVRAVTATTRDNAPDLDPLICAAAAAMGAQTWAVSDLLGRATKADPEGLQLLAAITATGALESSAKSLGRYLAERVKPGGTWITADGLELSRSMDGRLVVWTVARIL